MDILLGFLALAAVGALIYTAIEAVQCPECRKHVALSYKKESPLHGEPYEVRKCSFCHLEQIQDEHTESGWRTTFPFNIAA